MWMLVVNWDDAGLLLTIAWSVNDGSSVLGMMNLGCCDSLWVSVIQCYYEHVVELAFYMN